MKFFKKVKKSMKVKQDSCFEDIKIKQTTNSKSKQGDCFQCEAMLALLACSPCILTGGAIACGIIYGLSLFDIDVCGFNNETCNEQCYENNYCYS